MLTIIINIAVFSWVSWVFWVGVTADFSGAE
jgi:hypothetical protein